MGEERGGREGGREGGGGRGEGSNPRHIPRGELTSSVPIVSNWWSGLISHTPQELRGERGNDGHS